MTLESSKTLGGIGALLLFIGIFPYINFFGIVEIIGAILLLVALHGFANHFRERGMFDYALYGIIAIIVGVIVAIAIGIAVVLPSISGFIHTLYPSWNGDWSTLSQLSGMTPNTSAITPTDVFPFISAAIVIIVILWIFAIVGTFLVRRSLKEVSTRTSTGLFSTAGLLLLIGAILIIAFGLGLLLMWVGALILAIAFFTMKPQEQPVATTTYNSPPPTTV